MLINYLYNILCYDEHLTSGTTFLFLAGLCWLYADRYDCWASKRFDQGESRHYCNNYLRPMRRIKFFGGLGGLFAHIACNSLAWFTTRCIARSALRAKLLDDIPLWSQCCGTVAILLTGGCFGLFQIMIRNEWTDAIKYHKQIVRYERRKIH